MPTVPANFGEAPITDGRLQIVYATGGDATIYESRPARGR